MTRPSKPTVLGPTLLGPTVLGIETSCDETAAAVVRAHEPASQPENAPGHASSNKTAGGRVLSNIVLSQIDDHARFGGVVPEIAARSHLDGLDGAIGAAMGEAGVAWSDLDAIAVTAGPGLAGGLIVGAVTAQTLAAIHGIDRITVNHLEGHALTARLTDNVAFPYLLLLVSGGHSQILLVKGVGDYERWATTIDDALGEAFDKTGKLLGLPYPGGPHVEREALTGDASRYTFPRPLAGRETLNMSFSGLKTAVRKAAENAADLATNPATGLIAERPHICAQFQQAVADILQDRVGRAMVRAQKNHGVTTLVVAGGVAANTVLRAGLDGLCNENGWTLSAPPPALCTDNAAMIAWAGVERILADRGESPMGGIRPRWPLDEVSALNSTYGSGKKGAKA